MKIRTSLLIALGLVSFGSARADENLLIRDATVIDGTGARPKLHTDLLLADGKIAKIGRKLDAPSGTRIIDARGKYVMPGIIDTHVHFQFPVAFALTKDEEDAVRAAAPKGYLFNGVTSVLDAGGDPDFIFPLRQAQRDGKIAGPRIFALGMPFTPENGWGSRHGHGLHDINAVHERMKAMAAGESDGVKIIVEDGLGHAHTHVEIPDDMLQAAVADARAIDKRIYVHAINLTEFKRAIAFKPWAIIHGLEDPLVPGDTTIQDLIANKIAVTPTISLFYSFLEPDPRAGKNLDDPILVGTEPRFLLEKMRSPDYVTASKVAFVKAAKMEAYDWARAHNPIFCENIAKMQKAGVKLAVGTDAGGQVGYNFHGYNTPWEMKIMVSCGMTPMQTIVAATKNGAYVLGADATLGTLEPGKIADLLVLTGDPLKNIENVRKIEWVVQAGKPHLRSEFASVR